MRFALGLILPLFLGLAAACGIEFKAGRDDSDADKTEKAYHAKPRPLALVGGGSDETNHLFANDVRRVDGIFTYGLSMARGAWVLDVTRIAQSGCKNLDLRHLFAWAPADGADGASTTPPPKPFDVLPNQPFEAEAGRAFALTVRVEIDARVCKELGVAFTVRALD